MEMKCRVHKRRDGDDEIEMRFKVRKREMETKKHNEDSIFWNCNPVKLFYFISLCKFSR